MTVREITKMVKADGWYQVKGGATGHLHYKLPTKPGKVTISQHKGDLKPTTATSILRQAGLK